MKKNLIVAWIAGSSALFATGNSYAVCDGCVVGAVQAANTAISTAISTWSGKIVHSIESLNTNLANVGNKVSDSVIQASNAERELAIEVQRKAERERVERETQLPIDPCSNTSSNYASQAVVSAGSTASGYRRGGGGGSSSVSSPVLNKAINDPIPPVEVTRRQTHAIHTAKYCNAVEQRLGYQGCSASTMPDGDANVESALTGAGMPGKEAELTFSRDQEEAGRAYARLAIDPHPPENITRAEANTEQGKLYIAMQKAYQSNMSAAEKPLFDAVASRVPFPSSRRLIEEIKKSEAAAQYFAATASKVAKSTGTMSLAELQDFEAGRRFRNPYWVVAMGAEADPTKLQREQVFMQAFANEMLYQNYRKAERQEILLGMILASLTRNEMRPQIEAQLVRVHGTNAR